MHANTRLALLILGVLVGGVVGYVTRPQAAEIRLGGASFEIEDTSRSASDDGGALTTGQLRRVFVFAVAGGVVGLLAGVLADRRR